MQVKTQKRNENLKTLKMLDYKLKFKSEWNNDVKLAFQVTGSFSFDDLIFNSDEITTKLIQKYK
jgi:hypothetical protein